MFLKGTVMSTRRTRLLACLAAAGLVVTYLVAAAPQSLAATTVRHFSGNFIGDARDEIFEYRPGTGADYMFTDFSKVAGFVSYRPLSFTLNLTYGPIPGDFDGDGYDEIFWFGAGTAPDYLWDFVDGDPTRFQQTTMNQGGLYLTAAGDFTGDGADDIIWYAPGTQPDEIWDFNPGGGFTYTVHPKVLSGDYYTPMAGNFTGDGAEDLVFYGVGDRPDYIWDFEPGSINHASSPLWPVGATRRPFTIDVAGDGWTDIFWYTPGSVTDPIWNYHPFGIQDLPQTVGGTYDAVSGDFFGDGHGDAFWFGTSSTSVWDWEMTANGLTRTIRNFGVS
jgi:hypothetical protein